MYLSLTYLSSMDISENEKKIISILRELKPYEKIEISKDKNGQPDYFLIKREQKVVLTK